MALNCTAINACLADGVLQPDVLHSDNDDIHRSQQKPKSSRRDHNAILLLNPTITTTTMTTTNATTINITI